MPKSMLRKSAGKPLIAVTMGDPAGIGPEVTVKAVADPRLHLRCRMLVIGDAGVMAEAIRSSKVPLKLKRQGMITDSGEEVAFLPIDSPRGRIEIGRPTRCSGLLAFEAIKVAVDMAIKRQVDGIVTSPVSKRSFALAGLGTVGHTEILQKLTHSKDVAMMLTSGGLRVVFATGHVQLVRVSRLLTVESLVTKIRLANTYLEKYMGISNPRIGVACLNPHCGEDGLVGDEEKKVIEPAIEIARSESIDVCGPFAPDWLLSEPVYKGFDLVIAMYHDQGMIALRRKGWDRVVNITLGLPIVRTSPGHGTGFDIAGKGIASPTSMVNAILECSRIAKRVAR